MAKRDYVLGIDQQGGKGGGGSRSTSVVFSNLKHDAMRNRSLPNQHPISAITNLSGELSQRARYFVDLFDAPNLYTDYAGHAVVVNATEDGIEFGPNAVDMSDFFNGTFVESFNALVTSDGTTITMSLEQSGTGDLTMHFSDGDATLVCTPAATIELTAGTDTTPQSNYIYIPQSTGVLTKSTTGWPSAEHIKVSYFLVPSATFVQSDGTYVNQNWNDHRMGTDSQGHLSHMTMRMRRDGAYYFSGIDPNGTDQDSATSYFHRGASADIAYFKSSSGVIMQMHEHSVPAYDTSGTDTMLAVNWNGDAYHDFADLGDIVNDAEGVSLSNKYFNVAFFIVGNKGGEFAPLLVTLPSGGYASLSDAENDVDGYDNLSIPREFLLESSTGVAVCRMTLRWAGGTSTLTHESTSDMRMSTLSSGGGGGGGGVTDHGALTGLTDDDHEQYLLVDGTRAGATGSAQDFGSNGVKVDNIVESTTDANVTIGNHTIIGEGGNSQIASGTNALLIDEVTTDVSGSVFGIQTGLELDPAASSAAYHYGNYYNVGVKSTNAQNFTGAVIGLQSQVDHEGTGLIDHAYGGRFFVVGGSTGTFDVAYGIQTLLALDDGNASKFHGVHISDVYTTGSGYVNDELIGLYIEAQTEFNIAGYGMYVEDGVAPNFIGNNTRFGYDETTASALIYVKTALATQDSFVIEKMTSQTGNLFQVINGGFYDYFTINPSGQIVLQGDTTRTISTTPGGGAEPTGPSINIVADSGYTGINESDPDATLDIGGNIKIQGGVPGTGKVLTATDSTGVATWETPDTIITDHTGLSSIGTNTHAQIDTHLGSTSNPHSVTKAQVGLTNVPDLDTTDAVNNEHTHSNKTQLDLISDGDHDVRTDNPHSVTFSQVGGTLAHGDLSGLTTGDPHTQYMLTDGTRVAGSGGVQSFQNGIQANTVGEWIADSGVTVDGLLIKDGSLPEAAITEHEGAIDHDALTNFVGNEHIDWTQSGAGTIHADNYSSGLWDTVTGGTNYSGGNVGIGVPLPNKLFEIGSALTGSAGAHADEPTIRITQQNSATLYNIGDVHGGIEWYSDDTTGDFPGIQAYIRAITTRSDGIDQPDAGLVFGTSDLNDAVTGDLARDVMVLNGDGFLGLGTTTPTSNTLGTAPIIHLAGNNPELTLERDFSGDEGTASFRITSAQALAIAVNDDAVGSGTTRMTVLGSNGYIGINDTTPTYRLDVNGDIRSTGAVRVDTIVESTSGVGVTIDGVNMLNSNVVLPHSNAIISQRASDSANISILSIPSGTNNTRIGIPGSAVTHFFEATNSGNVRVFSVDGIGSLWIKNDLQLDNTNGVYIKIAAGTSYSAFRLDSGDDLHIGNAAFDDMYFHVGNNDNVLTLLQNSGTVVVENQIQISGGSPATNKFLLGSSTGLATWSYITPSTDSDNMLSSGTDNLPFVDDNIVFEQAGGNLYFNGSGGMEDNTNFEGFTYSGQYGYVGSGGFYTDTYNGSKFGTVDVSVDPSKDYTMSAYMRAPVNVGQRYYFAVHALDADGYSIQPYMGHPDTVVSGSTTTLTAKWTPGDLTMTVNDASGLDDSIANRSIVLGPYTNSYGYEYPEETYSRHSYPNNFTISGNVITFTSTPHAYYWNPDEVDGSWPIGTKLWQSASGGTYIYPTDTVNFTLTGTDWQQVTGSITSDMWWHGQAYVHLGYLVNRTTSGGDVAISGARFEVAEGGGTIDGSGTVNYLAIWSDTDTLGDSVIVESSGKIGIGRTPSYTLDVDGTARVDALIIDSTGSVTNAPYWSLDGSYNLVLANPDYNTTIGGETVHVIGEDAVSIQADWDVSGSHVKLNVTDGTTANTMELAVYKDRVDIIKGSTIVARIDDSGNMEIAGDLTTNATIT